MKHSSTSLIILKSIYKQKRPKQKRDVALIFACFNSSSHFFKDLGWIWADYESYPCLVNVFDLNVIEANAPCSFGKSSLNLLWTGMLVSN